MSNNLRSIYIEKLREERKCLTHANTGVVVRCKVFESLAYILCARKFRAIKLPLPLVIGMLSRDLTNQCGNQSFPSIDKLIIVDNGKRYDSTNAGAWQRMLVRSNVKRLTLSMNIRANKGVFRPEFNALDSTSTELVLPIGIPIDTSIIGQILNSVTDIKLVMAFTKIVGI